MLSVGIVGLPNVGKSTLFQALTKIAGSIVPYPFTPLDPECSGFQAGGERVFRRR